MLELSPRRRRRLLHESAYNLSTIDGREILYTHELRPHLSEAALHRRRSEVDLEAMIALSECNFPGGPEINEAEKARLRALYHPDFYFPTVAIDYDHIGRNGRGPLEHDVKANEMYLRDGLRIAGLERLNEWLHFPLTSEDTNNMAWNLMVRDGTNQVWLPRELSVTDKLAQFSEDYADVPVLGITHGMVASPTTMGKRFSYMLDRKVQILNGMKDIQLDAKFSGPVGNHNAMTSIASNFNFDKFAEGFISRFGFDYQRNSTQRNSHVQMIALLDKLRLSNIIGADICENIRHNVMMGWLYQEGPESHVGSSVMPHKINPWFFEVGQGYFNQAISQIAESGSNLGISVFERDLRDHPYERAYAEMMAKSLVGISYIDDGLDTLRVNDKDALAELQTRPEILSEAVQIAGRILGVNDIYMKIKVLTRGRPLDRETLDLIIEEQLPDGEMKKRIKELKPEEYIGIAPEIAKDTVKKYRSFRPRIEKGLLDPARQIDAVLFDFDGTLQTGDNEELMARLSAINDNLGLGFSTDEITEFGNRSDYREMRQLMVKAYNEKTPNAQITEDRFQAGNNAVTGKFDHHFKLAEGAGELLKRLKVSGKKIAVVSTRGQQSLRRILANYGVEGYFDVIISRDDVERRKPHQEPLAAALERLEVSDPSRAMYIGDKQIDDITPGNILGMKTALINSEGTTLERWEAQPTFQFNSLQPLIGLLGR